MSDSMDGCCTPGRRATDRTPGSPGEAPPASSSGKVRHHVDTLVRLSGGEFLMGTDDEEGFPADGEGPVRSVRLEPFAIDRHPVTNAQFAEFVNATGYVTEAERFGWSFVFALFVPKKLLHRGIARKVPGLDWWYGVNNALWNAPEGPGSKID
ncbi:MAG TPA: formylglycine-generating enzyme family protein, partial [Spirochaetia bacterium]|nr:formylglycine-generating enzyme family protein [Spirochaetia bacterium]